MIDKDKARGLIARLVAGGLSPEAAARQLREMIPDVVDEALLAYLKETGQIRSLKEPPGLDGDLPSAWYAGPDLENDRCWPALRMILFERVANGDLDEADAESIDAASTKVVSRLPCPGTDAYSGRGLVLGYVQSGKTANFTAVIAKAVDAGFRLVVVLSGTTNALRRQTQMRLNHELVDLDPEHWIALTSDEHDFRIGRVTAAAALLTTKKPLLCVVKKNSTVLRRLLRWVSAASPEVRGNCPAMVVDDEADQASVNTGASDDDRTKVNERIVALLELLPRVAYIGYTATPFANVFIDPSHPRDLYPRDFIIDLPKPPSYFGTERIFGRDRSDQDEPDGAVDGLDVIRAVPDAEAEVVKPQGRSWAEFEPSVPNSLDEAIEYFILATAARVIRGQGDKHSTMLVHTTLYADVHARLKRHIADKLELLTNEMSSNDGRLLQRLEALWDRELARVPASAVGEAPVPFDQLRPHLLATAEACEAIVENSRSDNRLDYEGGRKVAVVVGGNVLSRGLTLEGLIVSYFVRAASTYDTLLQMGRWFGYRRRYADLPRIWMTDELADAFRDLALVEHEMRLDIRRYEIDGTTPIAFGPRIRTHPSLMITSPLKMQHAVDCDVSYSNRFVQTTFFDHRSRDVIDRNVRALRRIVTVSGPRAAWTPSSGRLLRRDVAVDEILRFLAEYSFHPNNVEANPALLGGYIQAQVAEGQLGKWSVAVVGRQEGGRAMDVGLGLEVGLLRRAKIRRADPTCAYLGVITSDTDLSCDLPPGVAGVPSTSNVVVAARNAAGPLLLIYAFDGTARPRNGDSDGGTRQPLDAAGDLVGAAFVFPAARNPTPQRYKTVDLSGVPREQPEPVEEDDEEPAA